MDFINALKSGFNQPMMGLTENNLTTYLSSSSPCLDFFFHVVPNTPSSQLLQRLEASWSHDPLTILKLICNLLGIRGSGKSDKEGFYTTALWLHKHHPKTLACNAHVYASFGYFKDFLEILFRFMQGPDARALLKKEWRAKKNSKGRGVKGVHKSVNFKLDLINKKEKYIRSSKKKLVRNLILKEVRIKDNKAKMMEDKKRASQLRKKKHAAKAKKVWISYLPSTSFGTISR